MTAIDHTARPQLTSELAQKYLDRLENHCNGTYPFDRWEKVFFLKGVGYIIRGVNVDGAQVCWEAMNLRPEQRDEDYVPIEDDGPLTGEAADVYRSALDKLIR